MASPTWQIQPYKMGAKASTPWLDMGSASKAVLFSLLARPFASAVPSAALFSLLVWSRIRADHTSERKRKRKKKQRHASPCFPKGFP